VVFVGRCFDHGRESGLLKSWSMASDVVVLPSVCGCWGPLCTACLRVGLACRVYVRVLTV
jgi:hypothetical protein